MRFLLLVLLFVVLRPVPAAAALITVDTLSDAKLSSNGDCTLREAIQAANDDVAVDACTAGDGADTILIELTGTIVITSTLRLTSAIEIIGPGALLLAVDADANGRVFTVIPEDADVTIRGLTITGGFEINGGGVFVSTTGEGQVTITDTRIVSNSVTGRGGGVFVGGGVLAAPPPVVFERVFIQGNVANGFGAAGGGLAFLASSGVLRSSTVSGNLAFVDGGGIDFAGESLLIDRSTISGNTATTGEGGGLQVIDGTVDLRHTTVTGNIADSSPGIDVGNGDLQIFNTVTAGNTTTSGTADHTDFAKTGSIGALTTLGHNYVGVQDPDALFSAITAFGAGTPNAEGDYVGTDAAPLDPALGSLVNNGGPTLTHLPNPSAPFPLVEIGSCPGVLYDQRGLAGSFAGRVVDGPPANADDGCDIGAVEFNADFEQPVEPDVHAYLAGPYTDAFMATDLTAHIPLAQPYDTAPWSYAGTETLASVPADMVDWVLVGFFEFDALGELQVVKRRAMVLTDDGSVEWPDAYEPLTLDPGTYVLAVQHRNHHRVFGTLPVTVGFGGTVGLDLRLDPATARGPNAMQPVPAFDGTRYALWGGDASGNDFTNGRDALLGWLADVNGPPGYRTADFDLNGEVRIPDLLNVWLPANGRSE